MEEFILNPTHIERTIEPSLLGPDMARIIRHIDVTWMDGRVRRGAGWARTKIPSSSTTVTAIGIFQRGDGNRMVVDANTAGTVRLTVPEGLDGCPRSLVEYGDVDDFTAGVTFCENFNEECADVPNPGGGY